MNVTQYARIVHLSTLKTAPASLESVVLGELPDYAEYVAAVASAATERAELVRPQLMERLQASERLVDQDAARSLQPLKGTRGCTAILAVFAIAGAFALYCSLGDYDRLANAPAAMIFLTVCAAFYAWSALPARRTSPPPRSTVIFGGFSTVLGAAAVVTAIVVVIKREPGAMGWAVLGLVPVIALAATWFACARARRGLPNAKQVDRRLAEVKDELRASMLALIEGAEIAVHDAYARLEPAQRTNLEGIQSLVNEELKARSINPAPYVQNPPGVVGVGLGVRKVALRANIGLDEKYS